MSLKEVFKRHQSKIIQKEGKDLMSLDPQQKLAVTTNEEKVLVVAGAGSGKTRVITERVKYLINSGVQPQNIVAITFTNMASEEMKLRLKNLKCSGDIFIGTIHAFANRVMKETGTQYTLYNSETEILFYKELIDKYARFLSYEKYLKFRDLQEAVLLGVKSPLELNNFLAPSEMAELVLLQGGTVLSNIVNINPKNYPESIKDMCNKYNVIDFDDLLKMASSYFKKQSITLEHLLVDEFQDVGSLEANFLDSLSPQNTFFVGDDWQCQPEGTKITLEDGSVENIENLQVGDKVLSYNVKGGNYYRLSKRGRGKEIEAISVHNAENLVTITTTLGKETSYTKNHRCFARIHYEGNENKSVVYIMENDKGQFRVGSTQLFVDRGRNFGVRSKMNTEGAKNAWILDVFDTSREAWLCEQVCSYKFGIPQVTWTYSNIHSTEEDINKLYSHLDNLKYNVSKCLDMYGRDIKYPIFVKGTNKHFSKIHITEVHACNLINKVMDVAVPYLEDTHYKNSYEQIRYVHNVDNSTHKVYGLKIKDTETYVADGVLTHNSIYGFKGGNVNIMLSLTRNSGYKVYKLENNYRNTQEVTNVALQVIGQVSHKIDKQIITNSKDIGDVYVDNKKNIRKYLLAIKKENEYGKWFILCRTNAEIHKITNMLEDLNIPNITFKKENMNLETLEAIQKRNIIKVLTVHTAKGLEADSVLLYGNFPIYTRSYMRNEEERKVMYVGVTRAMKQLVILN